jgi:hypothetical protein
MLREDQKRLHLFKYLNTWNHRMFITILNFEPYNNLLSSTQMDGDEVSHQFTNFETTHTRTLDDIDSETKDERISLKY